MIVDIEHNFRQTLSTLLPSHNTPFAVAVSGGSDSMALLQLVYTWTKQQGISAHIITIDHGLRPESQTDCQHVCDHAKALGFSYEIQHWSGPYPRTGIQAAAREARHHLLAKAAADKNIHHILLGHTMDDQAETVWMRTEKRAQLYGFGAISAYAPSPAPGHGGTITLLRPMLSFRRSDLMAYLNNLGIKWRDDPSNTDTSFHRIRTRQNLAHCARSGRDIVPYLAQLGDRISAWDMAGWQAAGTLALRCLHQQGSEIIIDRQEYKSGIPRVRWKFLQAIMMCLSHRHKAAQLDRVQALDQHIDHLATRHKATLGGCKFTIHPSAIVIKTEIGRTNAAEVPFDLKRFAARTCLNPTLAHMVLKDPGHFPHNAPFI